MGTHNRVSVTQQYALFRQLQRELGTTYREIAQRIKVHFSTLYGWIHHGRQPCYAHAKKLVTLTHGRCAVEQFYPVDSPTYTTIKQYRVRIIQERQGVECKANSFLDTQLIAIQHIQFTPQFVPDELIQSVVDQLKQNPINRPLVITPDHHILYGFIHLMGAKRFGLHDVLAYVVRLKHLPDEDHLRQCLTRFTTLEKVAIAAFIEHALTPFRRQHQTHKVQNKGGQVQNLLRFLPHGAKTRALIANLISLNAETYRQAKKVLQHAPIALQEAVDQGDCSIYQAYARVKKQLTALTQQSYTTDCAHKKRCLRYILQLSLYHAYQLACTLTQLDKHPD